MGWHPASPEYANFPNPPKDGAGARVIRIKRGGKVRSGNSSSKAPTIGRLLSDNAKAKGWHNGKRLEGWKGKET